MCLKFCFHAIFAYGKKRNGNVWCGVQDMPHKTQQTLTLPEELWLEVFTHLEPTDLSRAAQVCRHWSRLIGQSETLWKAQCLSVTNSETKQRMLMDKAGDEKCWRVSYVCVLNNVVLLIVTLVVHVSNPYGTKIHWLSVNRLQTKDPIHWLSVNYLQKSTGCLSTYRPKIHWLSVNYIWTKEPLVVFQLPTDQRATGCQLPTDQRSTGCLSTAYRPKSHWLSVNCLQTKEPLVVCQLPTDQRATGCLSTAYRPKSHWLSVNCLQTKEPVLVDKTKEPKERKEPLYISRKASGLIWVFSPFLSLSLVLWGQS